MNNKNLAIVLILTIVISSLSLVIVKPISAQSTPKPSVPEFTVRYVDNSYDVPPIYGIDQYTGKNVIVQAGYHVDNRSVEFNIKNQQFTPYTDSNGNNTKLYYDFRWKGNYGDVWTYFPLDSNGRSVFHYGTFYNPVYPTAYVASNSDYSVLDLDSSLLGLGYGQNLPNGVAINFQVQALIGYFIRNENGYIILIGESSDWSNTQTITIGETSESASPTPTLSPTNTMASPYPTIPEFPSWTIPLLVSMMLATAVLLVYHKKHKHNLVKEV